MVINYDKHRKAIEKLYDCTCTINRYKKKKDPDTRETKLIPQLMYEKKPCRISQKSLATNSQTEARNEIRYETKLFIAPEIEILQGDVIEVTNKMGTVRKYTAGEPFPPYPTHQEVSIQRKDNA